MTNREACEYDGRAKQPPFAAFHATRAWILHVWQHNAHPVRLSTQIFVVHQCEPKAVILGESEVSVSVKKSAFSGKALAFVGTNPTDESIASGFPVIRAQLSRRQCRPHLQLTDLRPNSLTAVQSRAPSARRD